VSEERGCGEREAGGIYLMTPLSAGGRPVEEFLVCPPVPIRDPDAAGVSPIGVKVVQEGGTNHVVDWVGREHYPLVTDFVEEVRRMGVSRRVPKTFPFQLLSDRSMMILLHSRAVIANWNELAAALYENAEGDAGAWRGCPLRIPTHTQPLPEMCAGLWWDDGVPRDGDSVSEGTRQFLRQMPSFAYRLNQPLVTTTHVLGIFARFPIIRLEVIADPDAGTHEEALEKIGRCELPVAVVKE